MAELRTYVNKVYGHTVSVTAKRLTDGRIRIDQRRTGFGLEASLIFDNDAEVQDFVDQLKALLPIKVDPAIARAKSEKLNATVIIQ